MKRKTYRNFLIIRNKLMREKGYDPKTAEKLTHNIFDAVAVNIGATAEQFYNQILSREEYIAEYGIIERS